MILAPIQTLVAEIGSMFGSGEERPATIMGTIGVQLATLTRRGLLNRSGFPLLILLIVAICSSSAWGTCFYYSGPYSMNPGTYVRNANCLNGQTFSLSKCGATITLSGSSTWNKCFDVAEDCNDPYGRANVYISYCNNAREADSLICLKEGKEWDSQKGECKKCLPDTTWEEISCAYSPQRGQYLNVVNTYGVKDCETFSRSRQYYSPSCDSTGADSAYTCIGTIDGENVYMRTPWGATFSCAADGSCARAQAMIAAGECKAPKPTSSASSQSSSSEGEPTSSDSGESSSSEGEPSDTSGLADHVIVDELPQRLYDSLGAINYNIEIMQPFVSGIYDATYEMLGNQYDMKENQRQGLELLGDIRDATEGANTKLSTTNSLLNDIKNKNWNPNINVQNTTDVSGIQNRQDQTRDTLHNTNSLLEQIKGLLGSSGSDTIHVDTSKAPASIDSALKFWGNSANRTFSNAGLDTSTWGNANDSAAVATDSALAQGTWTTAMNCDTTGGRKCDSGIIGEHGLDSAASGLKSAYAALGDTLRNGAFGDSLSEWGSKFTGGVITGSGSGSCPAVLSRSYHVDIIGDTGFDMEIGYFLCKPVFGNVTPWALCRLLLRASIALACMWFLFKCATGFKGQGEDE